MQVFKAGVSDVGFKPFALQGEVQGLQVVSFFPIFVGCAEGGAYGQIVSQPFLTILMWDFFFPCFPDVQELLKYSGSLFQRKWSFMYSSFSGLMKR